MNNAIDKPMLLVYNRIRIKEKEMNFLSSAFKNFFITFTVCLLVFGFIGLQYVYPWLSNIANFDDMGDNSSESSGSETSDDTSDDTSEPVTVPVSDYDENGDVFTAVIMCVDSNNRAINCVFIDANAKSKRFIYCPIPTSIKIINEVGVAVPIGDMFSTMTPKEICQSVSSITGIETKYCLRFDREGIREVAAATPGVSITLKEDISIINPEYEDFIPVDGDYPEDYYINISNVDGRVLLNEKINGKAKLDWLLEYNPHSDDTEYNALYSQIAKVMIRQILDLESSLKSTEFMKKVIKNCETNLTLDAASGHLDTIFSYDDFQRHDTTFPANWETAVTKLRELDGSYNK